MSFPSSGSAYDLRESFSPSDQELFSLFLQYPEIEVSQDSEDKDSETQQCPSQSVNLDSSPTSTMQIANSDASFLEKGPASSPTLTTPMLTKQVNLANSEDCKAYFQLVRQSNLPTECLWYYSSLGHEMFLLQAELLGTASSSVHPKAASISEWLLKSVSYSCEQAARQVDIISGLKNLMAFNVVPGPANLCSTYMQRAKLIVKSVALPSKSELRLIRSLATIHDSYVHEKRSRLEAVGTINLKIAKVLDEISVELQMWLGRYEQWCSGMKKLKSNYIKPLIEQYSELPEAQAEFKDFQDRLSKARTALKRPVDNVDELTEQVARNLNLSARKKPSVVNTKRSRARYKREHTI